MPREVGEWTKDKLLVLQRYLPGYLQATTRAMERIYIDAFAGPGRNVLERTGHIIDGSPLIALKSRAANGTRFSRLFFIEQDPTVANELEDTLHATRVDLPWQILRGDVNDELPRLIRSLPARSPILAFLDTVGIEPRWETVRTVAPWRIEFLINFPLGMSINRNPESRKTIEYFGTEDCLPILRGQAADRTRQLLDLYKRRLAELGFVYTTENDLLIKTLNNQRLYYLILVSKVQPARTIMDWVFGQPDSRGQGRLL